MDWWQMLMQQTQPFGDLIGGLRDREQLKGEDPRKMQQQGIETIPVHMARDPQTMMRLAMMNGQKK